MYQVLWPKVRLGVSYSRIVRHLPPRPRPATSPRARAGHLSRMLQVLGVVLGLVHAPPLCRHLTTSSSCRRLTDVRCGPRVRIVSPGKNKERWLEDAIELYTTRLRGTLELECVWVRDDAALVKQARDAGSVIALDPLGKTCTSEEFAELLFAAIERGGSRLSFIIGGAEGLPKEVRADATLVSLSRLTFTHQMARLVLAEQIYRATEIRKGSGYHK